MHLAGLGLNLYQSDAIYKAMIREANIDDLFEGSDETLKALRAKIGRPSVDRVRSDYGGCKEQDPALRCRVTPLFPDG